jgi:hypothetical protein
MKRFIMNFVVGLVLIAGLVFSGCISPTPMPTPKLVLPDYVQRIEDGINTGHEIDLVTVQRFEDDGFTLWIWFDHRDYPGDCNYVVVGGIINRDTDEYRIMGVFRDDQIPESCKFADIQYDEYVEAIEQSKALPPKGRI